MEYIDNIILGNIEDVLPKLPNGIADVIVTSPPYWGCRDYGFKEQIGMEIYMTKYLRRLLKVTMHLKSILKDDGVMFWVHGNSYYGGSNTNDNMIKTRVKSAPKTKKKFAFGNEKSLTMQNYRLANMMEDEQDWILRNVIIWAKPSFPPTSAVDRLANSYEPIFVFVKSSKYHFNRGAVASLPYVKGDVWTIPVSKDAKVNHYATFPKKLARLLIKVGNPPENGLVLDPFVGSGTTVVVAKELGYHYLGIDGNSEYVDITRKALMSMPSRLDNWVVIDG